MILMHFTAYLCLSWVYNEMLSNRMLNCITPHGPDCLFRNIFILKIVPFLLLNSFYKEFHNGLNPIYRISLSFLGNTILCSKVFTVGSLIGLPSNLSRPLFSPKDWLPYQFILTRNLKQMLKYHVANSF